MKIGYYDVNNNRQVYLAVTNIGNVVATEVNIITITLACKDNGLVVTILYIYMGISYLVMTHMNNNYVV